LYMVLVGVAARVNGVHVMSRPVPARQAEDRELPNAKSHCLFHRMQFVCKPSECAMNSKETCLFNRVCGSI